MNYVFHLAIYFAIYSIVALSLNLVVGYCGLLTLAHAAYFAIGGYTYALASLRLGWGFIPSALLAALVASVLSVIVSLPAGRFYGDFFMLVSLSVQIMTFGVLYNWTQSGAAVGSLRNLTNGSFGISGIPKPVIFGIPLLTLPNIAALAAGTAIVCGTTVWLLIHSPWGRLLKCIRDDELAARGLGKHIRLARIQAFAFACGIAALGGVVYAAYVGYIDPSAASLDQSILMLSMVIVGGAGNFWGPFAGAFVLLLIPELLRSLYVPDAASGSVRLLLYGLFLVFSMHARPQGLAGAYRIE